MKYNATRLTTELHNFGIPIHGCASTGRVDFRDEATAEHRALAAQIVAAHDPAPSYADLRAKEYPTTDALVIALVEKIGEGRPEAFDALMAQRLAIKTKYPKP